MRDATNWRADRPLPPSAHAVNDSRAIRPVYVNRSCEYRIAVLISVTTLETNNHGAEGISTFAFTSSESRAGAPV